MLACIYLYKHERKHGLYTQMWMDASVYACVYVPVDGSVHEMLVRVWEHVSADVFARMHARTHVCAQKMQA